MPKYFYTAKSFKGETKSGFLEVKNESELSRVLRQEGYVLVSSEGGEEKTKNPLTFNFSMGVPFTEKMMFTRNLQVMIKAGISLPRAIRILAMQVKSKKFKETLSAIADEINTGKTLSSSLEKYPKIFPELFVNMIKVGEESGTLDQALQNLNKQMDREHDLRTKVVGALIYPAVVISAMVGIGILMLAMVVPRLAETFNEMGVELPPTTRVVMGLGTFLSEKWYIFLILIAVAILGFIKASKTKSGKRVIDAVILKLPIVSSLVIKTNSAYTTRTLSSLFNAGVPIVTTLGIVSGALGNVYFKQAISEAAEAVGKGLKLSEALKPHQRLFPQMVIQMMEIGEETGQTADILDNLASFYEEEVINATKNLSSVIEPVLMLIVGGAVGFFAISMIQPIYSILGTMQ
ncbi:MAG: type II secretion system F family protein [bacterium]